MADYNKENRQDNNEHVRAFVTAIKQSKNQHENLHENAPTRNTNEIRNHEEETDFIDILASSIMNTIDPIELAQAFLHCHIITIQCFEMCMEMSDLDLSRHTIFKNMLLRRLSRPYCGKFWHVVICILQERGFVLLSQRLERCLRTVGATYQAVQMPTNSNTTHRNFYTGLRQVVEQGSLVNPRDQFATLALKRKLVLLSALRNNQHKVRILADTYAATLIIGLDIPPADEDMEIFLRAPDKNMSRITNAIALEEVAHLTTNPLLTQLILYSRLMLVYAFAGNTQMSERMLTQARQLSYMTGACPELAEMYYFHVYFLLQRFEQNPTEGTRSEIEANVQAGLDILRILDKNTKTVHLWQQFLLMKLISCLVGIGNHCNVIHNCQVTGECIWKARLLFAQMDEIWVHVEKRRRMLYFLAKGRLEEKCGNLKIACHYIQKAVLYAHKGHFVEVKIMEDYLQDLIVLETHALSMLYSISSVISEIEDERLETVMVHPTHGSHQEEMLDPGTKDGELRSVKSFELFGDGEPEQARDIIEQNSTMEIKNEIIGQNREIEITTEIKVDAVKDDYSSSTQVNRRKLDFVYQSSEAATSVNTEDLFADGAQCAGFEDDVFLLLLQIERGEPDGNSNPD